MWTVKQIKQCKQYTLIDLQIKNNFNYNKTLREIRPLVKTKLK